MYYNANEAARIFPYLCGGILILLYVFTELRYHHDLVAVAPNALPGGFIPPRGTGYEYYVNLDTTVYLQRVNRREYRAYVSRGNPPAQAALRKDAHGTYFILSAKSPSEAESIVDQLYR